MRVIRRRRTNGISLTVDESSTWSLLVAVSRSALKRPKRVHPATAYHCDRLVSATRSVDCIKSKPGRKEKTSTKDTWVSSSI